MTVPSVSNSVLRQKYTVERHSPSRVECVAERMKVDADSMDSNAGSLRGSGGCAEGVKLRRRRKSPMKSYCVSLSNRSFLGLSHRDVASAGEQN